MGCNQPLQYKKYVFLLSYLQILQIELYRIFAIRFVVFTDLFEVQNGFGGAES